MVDDNDSPPPSSASSYIYLYSLPEPLRGFSIRALVPPDGSNGENCQEGGDSIAGPELAGAASSPAAAASFATSEKLDEFEIATRSHLLSLAEQLLLTFPTSSSSSSQEIQQKEGEECEKIDTLLQYLKNVTLLCLHVVKHHAASATNPPPSPLSDTNKTRNCTDNYSHLSTTLPLKKLPFLLIEDAFDTLPLTIIQTLWSSTNHPNLNLSSYATSLLCSPTIFVPPSKFVLLRICNKLLKQLSNQEAEDAEFAGSIMILLAKVFPLSERSAVNVLGSYNVRKSTKPEDITFATTETASFVESGEQSGGGSSNHESSTLAAGKRTGPPEGKSTSHDTNDSVIGYEFYKTFWGVQKVFTDPLGTILPSQLSQSTAAADAYGVFMKDVTSILMALESTPIAKVSSPSSKTSIAHDDDTSLSSRHHKYLTSRQLLHLQLKDAQLRVHFLTQLLIVLSHLASPNVTLPVPSLASDGSKATMQARVAEQTKQLSQVEKRAMELLRSTVSSSSSGSMCRFLLWILKDRESMWRAWKRAKCMPALDKVGSTTVSGSLIQGILAGEKKRKAEAAPLDDCTDSGKGRVDASSGGIIQNSSLSDMTDQNTQSIPTLESFLTPYVEALDPENGIEGEYHPRNDTVYCWRALRLMARDQNHQGQLCRFGKLRRRDGDFEGIVRDMWKAEKEGEEIGGTMIDVEYYADEIDLNDNMAYEISGGVSNGDNDALMLDDAASVGTPEEDVEARKEKMAEFERAAMEVEETLLNEEKDEENKDQIETSVKQHVGEESKGNASVKSVAVGVKDNGVPGKFAANNASTKLAANHSKVEETNEVVVNSNLSGSAVVADQSKGKINNANKSELSKGKVITTVSSSIGNDPSSHKVDQKKDEQKKTETNASAQGRPKFTPPQKKQQQQHTQPQQNEKSRDGARGRFVGRKDNADQVLPQHQPKQQHPQKQVQQQQQQQQQQGRIQPPQNQDQRSGGRDDGSSRSAHQRGSSTNDAGRRDGKSQSPLSNNTNDGGPPLGGRGSGGLGNKGKGGWEPPPPQGGGGNGRGTGGGVEGHGGSFRGRRQGGGARR